MNVLINHIDHVLASPGPLDNATLPRVPVIRIYGAASTGDKACVHVHQVYPYFFVDYPGNVSPDDVNHYIAQLSLSLNHAIALSIKRNPTSPNSQFIRAIILVKGVHFYGFHSSYTPFLKVLIADPAFVNRAATILQSGTVMHTKFRVYESHLSYYLQFLCDFGLYGCGWINLHQVWKRGAEEDDQALDSPTAFRVSPHVRQSRMPLEVDVAAHQILNRHRLAARSVHHNLTIPAPQMPSDPVVLSVRELWEDERHRRVARGLSPSPPVPIDLSKSSRGEGGDWVAEARWWEELCAKIQREKNVNQVMVESEARWEKWVMTTFESVEALWEPEWRTWKPERTESKDLHVAPPRTEAENPFSLVSQGESWMGNGSPENIGVDVDEEILSSQNIDQMAEHDWQKMADDGKNGAEDIDILEEDGAHQSDHQVDEKRADLSAKTRTPNPLERKEDPSLAKNPFTIAWNRLVESRYRTSLFMKYLFTVCHRQKRLRSDSVNIDDTGTPAKTLIPQQPSDIVSVSNVTSTLMRDRRSVNMVRSVITSNVCHREAQIYCLPIKPRTIQTKKSQIFYRKSCSIPRDCSLTTYPESLNKTQSTLPHNLTPRQRRLPSPGRRTTPNLHLNPWIFAYAPPPPSASELLSTLEQFALPRRIYRDPFYSKKVDVPDGPREYAGLVYRLKGRGLDALGEWQASESHISSVPKGTRLSVPCGGWEYASTPPSVREVKKWLKENPLQPSKPARDNSQISGRTQANIYGWQSLPAKRSELNTREGQHMTLFSMEVFVASRGDRMPDANQDEIVALFYALGTDDLHSGLLDQGILVVDSPQLNPHRLRDYSLEVFSDELDLINRIIDIIVGVDPDILVGWEVQAASWGYLSFRGSQYGLDVAELIARAPTTLARSGTDQWGVRTTTTFKVTGRHVFNVWRIMLIRFESVAFHLLRSHIIRQATLTAWYNSESPVHTACVLGYFRDRTVMTLDILEEAETTTKTAEFARVFGVDFYSVISRGSQFKVESFLFRIAKPESFVLLSPSKQDVGKQNSAECMPLIMEPLSAFYNGPLVVLDFQSLYPSVMIAYNYCYSTCLGRVADFQGRNKLGVTDLDLPPGLLERLQDHITIAPNGIIYVKPSVRQGLLGRMLTELLDTRVMVKQAMKSVKSDKAMSRILDARQLGLKYIANVTYGYTSATYSGRMPAVEIADSIVQTGRETLEKAIAVIDTTAKWGARVVYGDTDSVFIHLKGKTKEQAFKIGYDIADAITAMNPAPIKLKFEKVYLPCVLMAKKRYVGFKYETPDETEPTFDAKGIETVRRDGVPAQAKMTETCLKILFRTQDLSEVKNYCYKTWSKILRNRISLQDFIFAKEVRMGTYSDKVPPPPGVAVAARRILQDENDEPQYGERVPYVIVRGDPHTRLVEKAITPEEFLANRQLRIDASYYITRVLIPPLERIFNLVGADVRAWYDEMPKTITVDEQDPLAHSPRKRAPVHGNRFKIDEHFQSARCLTCSCTAARDGICEACHANLQVTIPTLLLRLRKGEQRLFDAQRICASCASCASSEPIACMNIDCPWLYERTKAEQKLDFLEGLRTLIEDLDVDD
ncbi:hypothetical protein L210DRAFT_3611257 [Boletus edulis BED1]|uniref:DNA polymerase n=1 Tax=Boletus edulis BED1 TaxID=1328754 RepID=A0AAD4BZQ9_BOLED|nr:hypothetical protein L210DRAFT_3611257 [Boletus edulis BED1]